MEKIEEKIILEVTTMLYQLFCDEPIIVEQIKPMGCCQYDFYWNNRRVGFTIYLKKKFGKNTITVNIVKQNNYCEVHTYHFRQWRKVSMTMYELLVDNPDTCNVFEWEN